MESYDFDILKSENFRQAINEQEKEIFSSQPCIAFEKNNSKRSKNSGSLPFNINGIISNLFKDPDNALILAIIFLLSKDGGDKFLIMALLYIML